MAHQAHTGAGFLFIGYIHTARRIVANTQHRQARRPAGARQTRSDCRGHHLLELSRQLAAIKTLGWHSGDGS